MSRRQVAERLQAMGELLDKVDRKVERIELVTVIREPSTGAAADAYTGLRKQVIAAAAERTAHLHQLAQFDAALRAGATADELHALVREWLGQASLEVVDELQPDLEGAFEVVGPEEATGMKVVRPAYVDRVTRRVIRAGVAERVAAPPEADHDEGALVAPPAGSPTTGDPR